MINYYPKNDTNWLINNSITLFNQNILYSNVILDAYLPDLNIGINLTFISRDNS